MNGKSLGHTGEELICWAREKTTRRGQTVKGLNAIHLLTCSRCAWLMSSSFGGEHMSTAAVPPWIGSDCVLANCIPGSQAKSEWSELSHFWYERLLHSTWFTCLFFHTLHWWPFTLAKIAPDLEDHIFFPIKDAEEVILRHIIKYYKACDLNRCVTVSSQWHS